MEKCPLCGFTDNEENAVNCKKCGETLEPTLAQTKKSLDKNLPPIAEDRFVIEGLFLENGNIKYHYVYEKSDPSKRYTMAVCPISNADPLANLGLETIGNTSISSDTNKEKSPFYQQFHLLAKFNSPGILRAHSYFTNKDLAYLVLERVEGHLLNKCTKLSETEARQIGIQLCQIADNFHRQRLVHNGLTPNSLVVDNQGLVKVIYFDRVRPLKRYQMINPIYITEGFSAPELYLLNEQAILDKRSDIYSIGAILYWLLTGETLSNTDSKATFNKPYQLYPQAIVSPSFERLILRALAIEPNDRYNSVNEMKFALAALGTPTAIQVAHASDIGRHREINEDSVLIQELKQCFESVNTHMGLYIVSDGMGGEAAGEVASRLTVRAVAEWVTERLISASLQSTTTTPLVESTQTGSLSLTNDMGANVRAPQLITSAILHANSEVLDYAHYHPSTRGLGATVTTALLVGNILTIGQVGDSRCYILSNDHLDQITEDHSLVERMVRRGELTKEEARFHPHRNIIYRSIGSRDDLEIDIVTRLIKRGDVILLCSDGLTTMLSDYEITSIMKKHSDPWQITKELIVAANAKGGDDNISVIVVKVD